MTIFHTDLFSDPKGLPKNWHKKFESSYTRLPWKQQCLPLVYHVDSCQVARGAFSRAGGLTQPLSASHQKAGMISPNFH